MKSLILLVAATLSLAAFSDDEPAKTGVKPKRNPMLVKTGGFIQRPGVKPGVIAILNAQKDVPEADLAEVSKRLEKMLHVTVPVKASDFKGCAKDMAAAFKADGSDFAVFVVDCDAGAQTIGIFPDQKFAFVNIAPLRADGGEGAFLRARTRKELARAFLYLTGGASSQSDNNVMGPLFGGKDLDKIGDDAIPVDVIARVYKYLPQSGCNTRTTVPYRTAVTEGWAPAPTNEYQQAIWDKMKSAKERGPKNAIKIPPPNAKK